MEVHFPPELEGKLVRIAEEQGRNSESLVFEAVERLIRQISEYNDWFDQEVDKGIRSADRGEFISHDRVRAIIDSRYPG